MQQSLSLPRIRPSEYINGPGDIIKDRPKFKKLRLNDSQQRVNVVIPPLKQNRTDRSVAAGLSTEERRNLKTQRTNVSLAEKKIREGNYDEEQEVGTDLSTLKRSCSQYNTENFSKSTEIERLRNKIDDIRSEIALQNNDSDAIATIVQMRREKYATLKSKCEEILYEKNRLHNMIRNRKADNIMLLGRVEEGRYELTKIKKHLASMIKTELEVRDRQNEEDGKYKAAAEELQASSRQNRRRLDEEQMKIHKFAESEINRDDRKKKLINISTSVVEEERDRIFRQNYNKFLANKALNRFLEDRMNRLMETNERILYLFRQVTESYGPFAPSEFTTKFQNQQPERKNITKEANRLESTITRLEQNQRKLKKESASLQIEYLSLGEQLENKNQKETEADAVDPQFYERSAEAEGKFKVINQWSDKCMKQIETIILDRKSRTQNVGAIPPLQRLAKIMKYVRSLTVDQQ